jgi:hypothetical protein
VKRDEYPDGTYQGAGLDFRQVRDEPRRDLALVAPQTGDSRNQLIVS